MMMIGIDEDAAAVRDEGRRWEVERKVALTICKHFFQKQLGWINSELSEQIGRKLWPFLRVEKELD